MPDMKTSVRAILTLWVFMVVHWTVIGAQSEEASSSTEPSVSGEIELQDAHSIRLGSTLVNSFVTVTNRQGRLIADLNASDFVVEDNGVRRQITEFSQETQLPLTLALVIDRSQSVQARFELERSAAVHFLESVLRQGLDRGGLVAFDAAVYLIRDFTDDVASLTSQIRNLSVAGNSGVFDAVYKTAQRLFGPVGQGRKAIILITDGDDTVSERTLQQAIDMVWRTDVIVYPIGIKGTKAGMAALGELANATGGRALFLDDEHPQLAELFAEIEKELRTQYSIGFQLHHAPDGLFHRLKVRVKKRGLRVRARKGYYALSKTKSRSSARQKK